MRHKFNIIIPSIQLSNELKFTLKKLNHLKCKNYFVTIVLNKKKFKKKPKVNYPLKYIQRVDKIFFTLICYWGFSMLASIQTMDRFDDPKGKQIHVPQTD